MNEVYEAEFSPTFHKTNPPEVDSNNFRLRLNSSMVFELERVPHNGVVTVSVCPVRFFESKSKTVHERVVMDETRAPFFMKVTQHVWDQRVGVFNLDNDRLMELLGDYKLFSTYVSELEELNLNLLDDGSPLQDGLSGIFILDEYLNSDLKVEYKTYLQGRDQDSTIDIDVLIVDMTSKDGEGRPKVEYTEQRYDDIPIGGYLQFIAEWREIHITMMHSWQQRKQELERSLNEDMSSEIEVAKSLMDSKIQALGSGQ